MSAGMPSSRFSRCRARKRRQRRVAKVQRQAMAASFSLSPWIATRARAARCSGGSSFMAAVISRFNSETSACRGGVRSS